MAEANLKGCHPVQNLGATETYIRRYLWQTALEIVEHDAIDGTESVQERKEIKPSSAPNLQPPPLSNDEIILAEDAMRGCDNLEALKAIFGGAYSRANQSQKISLKTLYDMIKLNLEKEEAQNELA
jgi:hypothetical protein